MEHTHPIRVYYEDTDSGGVVYYANYLKFAERGRTELLRFLGFGNKSLGADHGVAFVVRHIEADYFKPAVLEDDLIVKTKVSTLKNVSVIMDQEIQRGAEILFAMRVTLACIDVKTQKPVKFPVPLRDGLSNVLK